MRKKHAFNLLLLLACLACCCSMSAQDVTSSLSCRRFTTLDGLPQMQTEALWQDERGYIYVGTLSGFARYDGQTLTPLLSGRRENIVAFREVEGCVRALNFRRQWLVDGEKVTLQQIDAERQWLLNNFNGGVLPDTYVILEDERETHRRLCRLEEKGWSILATDTLLDRMTPDRKLFIDTDSTAPKTSTPPLYVPTSDGLFVSDRYGFRLLSSKTDIFTLHRAGNTLYALAGDGIYVVGKDGLTLRHPCTFEAPDYGLVACHDHRGRLVIADSHTIHVYDGKKVEKMVDGFNLIKGMLIDKWGRLWVATYQGLYCYFTMDFHTHRLADANDIARALAIDGEGRLVMATLNGKVLVDGKVADTAEGDFYIPGAAAVGGRVFVAGKNQLRMVEDGRVSLVGQTYDRCQFVKEADGMVVYGTRNMVLAYNPESGRTDTLSTDVQHPWCAASDIKGRLWVGTSIGLYRLSHLASQKWSVEHVDYPQKLIITAMDGDLHGNIIFASADSIFLIKNGEIEELNSSMPQLAGHEVRSIHFSPKGFLVVAVLDGIFIARIDDKCTVGDVSFFNRYNGFAIVEPQQSPMAEEADGNVWLAGLEEMTSFLPERLMEYRQEDMIVHPPTPWWMQWWALLAALTLLTAIVWLFARNYERKRTKRAMDHLWREKTQKELLLSAIRLKSIPHFNSNVLSGIEYYVMSHSVEEASYYLRLYSKFTNSTLADIDRPARTVQEEVDYVENYLKLEKMRYGDKLNYSIDVGEGVNPQTLLPNMILHTYSQNAIKHGIAPKETPGHVDISIQHLQTAEGASVVVTVSDDGIGRAAAAQLNTNSTKKGLTILIEQLELHNQANTRHIVQRIEDLYQPDGTPAGTRCIIEVPEGYKYE